MRFRPGQAVDHYTISESLGQGAYAETYKAVDASTGGTVVLKFPNPQLFADPGLFSRYQREVDIARLTPFTGVFEPLKDPAYFAQVRVEPDIGTIVWPSGAQLGLTRSATGI